MNADDKALSLAARIADGSAIDWADAAATPADADPAVLDELRAIAALAALHRAPSDWPSDADAPPVTQWGPLTLLGVIGEGLFGRVYRAWDPRLHRQVALKLLHAPTAEAAGAPIQAIEEARLLARVRHPNVLTVYGAESIDDQVGIWTEFIDGHTLDRVLADRGPLPADEVVSIGIDLCRALGAVHAAGLLHRDIKAQNVMRETGGRIVLMDFGTGHDLESVPSRAGDLSGTPLYLAPEIFDGGAATVASDVYAVAVLLYRLLAGRYPVEGRTLEDVRAGHAFHHRPSLMSVLPPAVVETLAGGLAVDPRHRYRDAHAFEAALLSVQATSATPNTRRSVRPMALAAVAAVTIAALALAFTPASHDLYLQGRYQLYRRTPEALRTARDLFERAIERDPSHASSHAGLAEAYTLLGAFGVIPREESYARARQAANDSLRLDDRQSMPYAVLGYITLEADLNVPLAFEHFRAAIARDPNNGTAHQWFALSLSGQGRRAEALEEIERAREVDPLSKSVAADAGNLYRVNGNPEKAREHLRVLVSLDPQFAEGRRQLGLVNLDLLDYLNAVTEFEAAIALAGPVPYLLGDLGYTYARLGRTADAYRVLATLQSQSERGQQWYWAVVYVNGGLGRVPEAVETVLACRKRITDCVPTLNRPGLDAVGYALQAALGDR